MHPRVADLKYMCSIFTDDGVKINKMWNAVREINQALKKGNH